MDKRILIERYGITPNINGFKCLLALIDFYEKNNGDIKFCAAYSILGKRFDMTDCAFERCCRYAIQRAYKFNDDLIKVGGKIPTVSQFVSIVNMENMEDDDEG